MKKLIYIFTIFISLFIFYDSFRQNVIIEKSRVENAFSVTENDNQFLIDVHVGDNRNQFYDDLISFVKENKETAYISTSYQDKDMIDYGVTYVYSTNTQLLLKTNDIHLENNKIIDFSKPTSDYYSTDLDDSCLDHIVFLDEKLNEKYNKIYEFHQFEEIKNVDYVDDYYVFFITSDKDKLKEKVNNSSLSTYLNDIPDIDNFNYTKLNTSLFDKLLVICVITIVILMICDILKRKKEIMIRKLNGMSNLYIALKIYYKQFFISSLLYLITFIICYCIWIGRIHEVAYEFMQIQFQYFCLFVLLNICIWFLIYIMIHFMKKANELKKSAYLKVISISDILLKVIVLILLINPFIEYTKLGIHEASNLYNVLLNEDVFRDQLYVYSMVDGSVDGIGSVDQWVRDYMHKKGAIYHDFTRNCSTPQEFPYILVNNNYMKDYNVIDADTNKVLDFTNIKKEVLLIPEKYRDKDIDSSLYTYESMDGFPIDCDIIYVKNGQKYLNHHPLSASDYGWSIKDPIVYVEDKIRNWSYPFLLLPYEDMNELEQIKKDFAVTGIEDYCILNNMNVQCDIIVEMAKDSCLEVLFIMVVYAIVICVFLYQSIFIYFIENKEKCALKYIHGYSFMERHGEMLLMNISIYIIPLLVGWFYYHIPLIELLLVIGIAILFEIFSMWIITRIFEKNKIIEILKGE